MTNTQNTKIGTTGTTELVFHDALGTHTAVRFYRVIPFDGELGKDMYRVAYSDVWSEMFGQYGFLRLP